MKYTFGMFRQIKFRLIRDQRGIGLLEIIVAVGIIGLIGTAVIGGLETNYRSNRTLDERVTAINLSTAYIEAIRNLPYAANYPNAGNNITVPQQYTVTVTIGCSSNAINFSPCTGTEDETFQRITISVSREGKPVYSACAFRSK